MALEQQSAGPSLTNQQLDGTLKVSIGLADSKPVTGDNSSDEFCLYLWRSPEAPGVLYLTRSMDSAREVYRGLEEHGYIVKAIHTASGREFELSEGVLLPVNGALARIFHQ